MTLPRWLINISVSINNLTGGPKNYSLCARFYEGRLDGRPVHIFLVKAADTIFWFDPGHCRKAWQLRHRPTSI